MEQLESVFQGPMLYLLIVWGIVTIAFIVLIIWRSLLSSHEDDQMFLDSAQAPMEREQRELIGKIDRLVAPAYDQWNCFRSFTAGYCGNGRLPGSRNF